MYKDNNTAANYYDYTNMEESTFVKTKKNIKNIGKANQLTSNTIGAFGKLAGFNREHLSKSIILHHNKMNTLLSTAGRYNDVMIQDIEEDEDDNDDYVELLDTVDNIQAISASDA